MRLIFNKELMKNHNFTFDTMVYKTLEMVSVFVFIFKKNFLFFLPSLLLLLAAISKTLFWIWCFIVNLSQFYLVHFVCKSNYVSTEDDKMLQEFQVKESQYTVVNLNCCIKMLIFRSLISNLIQFSVLKDALEVFIFFSLFNIHKYVQ